MIGKCSLRWLGGLAVLVPLAGVQTGRAAPVPKTPAEVEKESDVVGTVRVLGVVCLGERPFPHTDASSPVYQAWLQLKDAKKGLRAGQTVVVEWQDVPKTVMGPWKVAYYPGEVVSTQLKWDPARRVYTTTWFTSKGKSTRAADTKKLPEKAGEVVLARPAGREPKKK